MKGYYVQMHLHTAESSACGVDGGAQMALACARAGYAAIATSDHFFNSNINVDRRAPWPEQVAGLFRGYYAAKAAGDKLGLTVLKAWETFTQGQEFLTYGLGEEFLLDNPDIAQIGIDEYLARVRAAGGFVVQAHPFRKASYIPDFIPDPARVEAFEVYNAAHEDPSYNEKARRMAEANHLIQTAGADAHSVERVRYGAMRFPEPVLSTNDLVRQLRAGRGEICESI